MRSRGGKVHLKTDPAALKAAGILLDAPPADQKVSLRAVFGNNLPVEAEIGSGKGAFLLRRAKRRPEINLLGIEWVPAYAHYVADRALRAGLANVRVLCADAARLFNQLPDRCLWRIHIYFPDPWPKRKHLRRRLLNARFLAHMYRVLRPGGWLGIVTDHRDYFQHIRRDLSKVPRLAVVSFPASNKAGFLVGSNFEAKYAAKGKSFYTIAAVKY